MTTPPTTNSSDGSEEKRTELLVPSGSPRDPSLDTHLITEDEECPRPDEYGRCVCCGHRYKVFCTCNTTFAERARSVAIDAEALRRFHGR